MGVCPAWSLQLNAPKPGSGAGGLGATGVLSLDLAHKMRASMFSFLEWGGGGYSRKGKGTRTLFSTAAPV